MQPDGCKGVKTWLFPLVLLSIVCPNIVDYWERHFDCMQWSCIQGCMQIMSGVEYVPSRTRKKYLDL